MELLGFFGLGATIVGTGIALAGLILRQANQREARLDARLERLEARLDARLDRVEVRLDRIEEGFSEIRERVAQLDRLEARLEVRLDRIEEGFSELRERMAKLEGLLEGLREAIAGRRPAAPSDPA